MKTEAFMWNFFNWFLCKYVYFWNYYSLVGCKRIWGRIYYVYFLSIPCCIRPNFKKSNICIEFLWFFCWRKILIWKLSLKWCNINRKIDLERNKLKISSFTQISFQNTSKRSNPLGKKHFALSKIDILLPFKSQICYLNLREYQMVSIGLIFFSIEEPNRISNVKEKKKAKCSRFSILY